MTYITPRALSVNEGGSYFNFHISWAGRVHRGFYVYLFGWRVYKFWNAK